MPKRAVSVLSPTLIRLSPLTTCYPPSCYYYHYLLPPYSRRRKVLLATRTFPQTSTSRVSAAQHWNPLRISFPTLPGNPERERDASGPVQYPTRFTHRSPRRVSSTLTKEPPCRAPAPHCDHGPVLVSCLVSPFRPSPLPTVLLLRLLFRPRPRTVVVVCDLHSGSSCARAGRYEHKRS